MFKDIWRFKKDVLQSAVEVMFHVENTNQPPGGNPSWHYVDQSASDWASVWMLLISIRHLINWFVPVLLSSFLFCLFSSIQRFKKQIKILKSLFFSPQMTQILHTSLRPSFPFPPSVVQINVFSSPLHHRGRGGNKRWTWDWKENNALFFA